MTTPLDITAKFMEAYGTFIVIEGQPTNLDVNRVFEVLYRILYPTEYDETNALHNLIGIILGGKPYTTKHDSSLPRQKCLKIFDKTIDGSLPVTIATQKKEAAHTLRPTGRFTTRLNAKAAFLS